MDAWSNLQSRKGCDGGLATGKERLRLLLFAAAVHQSGQSFSGVKLCDMFVLPLRSSLLSFTVQLFSIVDGKLHVIWMF